MLPGLLALVLLVLAETIPAVGNFKGNSRQTDGLRLSARLHPQPATPQLPDAPLPPSQAPYRIYLEQVSFGAGSKAPLPYGSTGLLESALRSIQLHLTGCLTARAPGADRDPLMFRLTLEPQQERLQVASLPSALAPDRQAEAACVRDRIEGAHHENLGALSASLQEPARIDVVVILVAVGAME
jgi:hypothetical protein